MRKKERVPPTRVHSNEVYQVIPQGPPNGTILAMNLVCGKCKFKFEGRYSMSELSIGFPHETCPNCATVNYVPYTISGRNGN